MNFNPKLHNVLSKNLPQLLLAILFALAACQDGRPGVEDRVHRTKFVITPEQLARANDQWRELFNQAPERLADLYRADAVMITTEGQVLTKPEERAAYWQEQSKSLRPVSSTSNRAQVKATPLVVYEINEISTTGQQPHRSIVIWQWDDDRLQRQLEFRAPATDTPLDSAGIRAARDRWITLCNQHDAHALVSALYVPEAIYYNHKPLIRGIEAISEEYSYMDLPRYALSLTPLHLVPVNDTLAFEIGQCGGTYEGKYLFVWRKMPDGEWKIWLDSNV